MNSMEKLLIIGAGGHGKVVADAAKKMNRWNDGIVFLDDNQMIKTSLGIEIIGKIRDAKQYINDFDIFVAIGNAEVRENILEELISLGANISTIIHPNTIIGDQVEIDLGTFVMAGAIINCCSSIGMGCIVNTGATIDHDNNIGNYVHISPGTHVAGTVNIGDRASLGIGSIVINNINITGGCIIGAGAVVVNNITEIGTYIGVPARRIVR